MAAITWSVEDHRTGRRRDGTSPDVPTAKHEAIEAVLDTGRKGLVGIKATVVRTPRTGAAIFYHLRAEKQRYGADKLVWEEVKADA